jgi:Bacteriophage replication gene A protein (GPA)
MPAILRTLPTAGLSDWEANKPRMQMVQHHLQRVLEAAPASWRQAIRSQLGGGMLVDESLEALPEWAQAWDKLQQIAGFDARYGNASRLNLSDYEICTWAKRLSGAVGEFLASCQAAGMATGAYEQYQALLVMLRGTGALSDEDLDSLFKFKHSDTQEDWEKKVAAAIERACDGAWWRRRLRRHVARVVEAGAIRLGLVNVARGRYISHDGLQRRQAQIKRNIDVLTRSLYRNEAGQVYTLAELAALGTANPAVRGGELMTRIRGAEEYADSRGHFGLFITLTLPSKYHPVAFSGGKTRPNEKYQGATPRDGQQWLCSTWAKARAQLGRKGIKIYGLRVAEPHHDGTPHWHALLWTESLEDAQQLESTLRRYWLKEDGNERGAQEYRVCIKRMEKGGAAGYVAKYIAKSVGHIALADHQDLVSGEQIVMDFGVEESQGHQRVDAWAACWGIRQFQTIGMPSVTAWRELRRVSHDQLELFAKEGDQLTMRAYRACHRHGDIKADWRVFMEAMGGHARRRDDWHLKTVNRMVEDGQVNKYGEEVKVGRIVGLTPRKGRMSGRWLVSRRIAWVPVAGESSTHASHDLDTAQKGDAAEQAQGTGMAGARVPQARAWTGFNNCTARITGELRRTILGVSEREKAPTYPQETIDYFRRLRQMEAQQ